MVEIEIFKLPKFISLKWSISLVISSIITFFFQNFNVCKKCIRLAQLYHKLQHQKHKMFIVCSDVVETRKKNAPELDTTRMLNELLADDSWLEAVRKFKFFRQIEIAQFHCKNFVKPTCLLRKTWNLLFLENISWKHITL